MTSASGEPPLSQRCPCCSGLEYSECCLPRLDGTQPAPTAQALMRSRFTAFAVRDREYLLASWHPDTRPAVLRLEREMSWYRLDIESTRAGTPFDDVGEVRFVAWYRSPEVHGTLREHSWFRREAGRWYYLRGAPG